MTDPYAQPDWLRPKQPEAPRTGYGPPPPPSYGAPQQPYGYGPPAQQPPVWSGYPPGYGYPQAGSGRTNGMAIASMVLGILWLYWIGSILALIFGYVARSQIKQSGEQGGGMAIAGIVLGWIGIGIFAFFFFVGMLVAASDPGLQGLH